MTTKKALEISTSMMEAMMVQMHSWDIEPVINVRGQMAANKRLLEDEDTEMREVLRATQKLVSEGAMTGFSCHDGDWAERLFANQANIHRVLK